MLRDDLQFDIVLSTQFDRRFRNAVVSDQDIDIAQVTDSSRRTTDASLRINHTTPHAASISTNATSPPRQLNHILGFFRNAMIDCIVLVDPRRPPVTALQASVADVFTGS